MRSGRRDGKFSVKKVRTLGVFVVEKLYIFPLEEDAPNRKEEINFTDLEA